MSVTFIENILAAWQCTDTLDALSHLNLLTTPCCRYFHSFTDEETSLKKVHDLHKVPQLVRRRMMKKPRPV